MTVGGAQLRQELAALGVRRGAVVLVHCSLSSIGRIEGGAAELCAALLDVLGPQGTLVVPSQTRSTSTTSRESRVATAGLTPRQRERYFRRVRGFDPQRSRTEHMGALAEFVRVHPETRRSGHPTASFAAIGPDAAALTASHPYDSLLGGRSPLGWLYHAGADVLLAGVGYDTCTAFHLGEHDSVAGDRSYWFKVGKAWRYVPDAQDYDDSDFAELGREFEHAHRREVRSGPLGAAESHLFPLAAAADFAAKRLPGMRLNSRLKKA